MPGVRGTSKRAPARAASALFLAALLAAAASSARAATTAELLAEIGRWDGKTEAAELAGPYGDPVQQNIPFGCRSYFLTPWRAYMDTWPASRFLECLGICFKLRDIRAAEAVAQVFAEAGIRSARVEIGWGNFRYDDPTQMDEAKARRYKTILRALKAHGIRPLILLNANSGWPCPIRTDRVTLVRDAPAGAREIFVDDTARIVPHYTGLRGQAYQIAFPLITEVDAATGRCALSAPLRKGLTRGPLSLYTLKYHPFSGRTFADGRPNPSAQETVEGWMTYVAAVCRFAKAALGTEGAPDAGFDVEVWNEYTFGSHFLQERKYYDPPREFAEPITYSNHGRTRTGHEIILPMTVDFVNDPKNGLPGVRVISGFSNQRPWENGADMWPGQAGFSRHYYASMDPEKTLISPQTQADVACVINALGEREAGPGAKGARAGARPCFIPTLRAALPEFWHYGYKTEFITRDVQPFPGPWKKHQRFSHPGTGRPAEVWMTEFNMFRWPWAKQLIARAGCAKDDPRLVALMHYVGAKVLLRAFVFHAHKGVHTINVFAAQVGDCSFGVLPEAFFAALEQSGFRLTPAVRKHIGPQLETIGRLAALMREGEAIAVARPLQVVRLVEHRPRLAFRGDGTPAHPDRWHRDDFACLPYQLAAGRFAVACYVVTRDITHEWDAERDVLDPARYDMPAQTFDLTLGNVCGAGARVSLWDPMRDRTLPAKVLDAGPNTLCVRLAVVDYPRFLLIDEPRPGPLIISPTLEPAGEGVFRLRFGTNIAAAARVSWGAIPQREGEGAVELSPATAHKVRIGPLRPGCGVKVVVRAGELFARWPRWGHDVQGQPLPGR